MNLFPFLRNPLREGTFPEGAKKWLPGRVLASAAMIAAAALASPGAMAGPVVQPDGSLLFLYSVNGGADPSGANPPPPGPTPWLKALIKQAGPNAVDIILTPSLGGDAYALSWGFNMKPSEVENPVGEPLYLPSDFTYSCSSTGNDVCAGMGPLNGVFSATTGSYIWDPNNVNMQNGWTGFDMKFDLPNAKANRLEDGTVLTIRVGRSGITPDAFNYPVVGDTLNGEYTAAHVGGYGYSTTLLDNPGNGTPAPGPLPILGAAAAFQASRRLRRRLKPVAVVAPRSV